ncbi:uncharacterized protein [Phyllobates terribilis]|uniref:uncharacterized protein n=1 Tax=Phyllobates terribilis TaxID=111132 RepID=UPI003CCAF991
MKRMKLIINNTVLMNTRIPITFLIIISLIIIVLPSSWATVVSTDNYNDDFFVLWSPNHINTSSDGRTRRISLDQQSGGAFCSNQKFLFGQIDMKIKLVAGDSAGTVVAFYLTSSENGKRDEIDLEFLGNVTEKPYILQTNVYVGGSGDREERIYLWFDPTREFHTYSILWSLYHIVVMVDWVPIRVYRNHEEEGVAYPRWQAMSVKASIWDGGSWATRGGKDKIDWSAAPFVASFGDYKFDACVWSGSPGPCGESGGGNWWNDKGFMMLTWPQRRLLKWARNYHLVYDYCHDNKRFNFTLPKECSLPMY